MRFHHLSQAGDAAGGESLERSGGNGIDANFLFPEITGQITHRALEGGLGYGHDVVFRDDSFGAVIGHRDDGTAVFHERSSGPRNRDQGVHTDIMGDTKSLASGIYEVSLQFLGG